MVDPKSRTAIAQTGITSGGFDRETQVHGLATTDGLIRDSRDRDSSPYCGDDLNEGERLIDPLRKFGPPASDMVARMPYVQMQQMLDAAAPYGIRSYWKSSYLRDLTDDGIDTFLDFAGRCPSPRTFMILEHAHGAAARVAPTATAFHVRDHAFNVVLLSLWADAADDARNTEWTRSCYSALQPWATGSVYVNALAEDDSERINEAYGPNYTRLVSIKAKYDPSNRFRRNQNIRPQEEAAAR